MKFNWRRFFIALAAVVIGNAIYFALTPVLPQNARHAAFKLDWGLVLDFWICVVVFNLLLMIFKAKSKTHR
jgi:hypothetical protein